MEYGYTKKVAASFSDALLKIEEELAKEGFGILTKVDVQATLKKKLDVEYGSYVILGACNPSLAYRALLAEKEIGLLLPCNVIVYEENDSVFVSAILPKVAMGMVSNPALSDIAEQAEEKLKRAVDVCEAGN